MVQRRQLINPLCAIGIAISQLKKIFDPGGSSFSLLKTFSVYTTRKHCIYDAPSMTVLENHFRIWRSGNFVNRGTKICFYVVHFKAIINNHLRMYGSGNLVIA